MPALQERPIAYVGPELATELKLIVQLCRLVLIKRLYQEFVFLYLRIVQLLVKLVVFAELGLL